MQEAQILVKKEDLAVYDKVSNKIFAGGLPKVTLLFDATPYANAGAALVHFPPNLKHWHGAGVQEDGEHIAVTFEKDSKNVTWLEHLSEDEYKNLIKKADELQKIDKL